MRRLAAIGVAAAALVFVTPAHAGNWSLGANMGLSFESPDGGDMVTVIGWPSSVLGLRVGFVGQNPVHEVYVDSGLEVLSTKGFSQHAVQVTGNYQYNFKSTGSNAPFLTGGLGFASVGASDGSSVSAVATLFGGGIGLRHKMANGNGTLRGEARFDHNTEGKDGGAVIVSAANTFGIKLGFDLWGK